MNESHPVPFTYHHILPHASTTSSTRKLHSSLPTSNHISLGVKARPSMISCDYRNPIWPTARLHYARDPERLEWSSHTHPQVPHRTGISPQQPHIDITGPKRGQCTFVKDEEQRSLRVMRGDTPHISELTGDLDLKSLESGDLGIDFGYEEVIIAEQDTSDSAKTRQRPQ